MRKGMVFIVVMLLSLVGCKNSNSTNDVGSNSTGVTYSGKTTPAVITSTNAISLTGVVVQGTKKGTNISLVAPRLSNQAMQSHPLDLVILVVTKANIVLARQQGVSIATGVVQTQTMTSDGATDFGPGGTGTMTMVSKIDDVTGLGSITATYNNYGVQPNLMNGEIKITVSAVDVNKNPTSMSIIFTDFSATDATGTSRMAGTISVSKVGTTETLTMSFAAVDATGHAIKMDNVKYIATNDSFGNLLSEDLSGRFYDSNEGYVDIVTTNPLNYSPAGSSNPSSGGPVIFTGANNAKVRMTPVNGSSVTIDIDANGDGVYESTQTVAWSSL